MQEIAQKKAQKWLDANNITQEDKIQIHNMIQNDVFELAESFTKDLVFGTGGIRGIMGIGTYRINKYTIAIATQGFVNYLKKQNKATLKVAIAYDTRNNSKLFANTVATVFAANHIKVFLFEQPRPTPELSYAIRSLGCDAGVMITASHNPKEYNGYKAYWEDGGQIIYPHDENIIKEVTNIQGIDDVLMEANESFIQTIGKDIDTKYLQNIKELSLSPKAILSQKKLSIVYTAIHGTGGQIIPQALKEIGFENVHVVASQQKMDGNFPTVVYPNPEEHKALSIALKEAEKIDADLVMATDPDADRVGIAVKNPKGDFLLLNGNQIGVLIVYYLLTVKKEKGLKGNEFVVKTIVTTELIRTIANDFSVNCYDTLTGFKFIAALIRKLEPKEKFIGGGEESYGYLIGSNVRDKDAVASCAILAEMTAWARYNKKSVYQLLTEIYEKYGFYYESLKSITKKGLKGSKEIEIMMENFRNQPPRQLAGSQVIEVKDYLHSKITKTEGLEEKIQLPKSNVMQFITNDGTKISIRPSGTEPKVKFYFAVIDNFISGNYELSKSSAENKIKQIINELNLN